MPSIPQAITSDAISEKKIIAAENVPNSEKNPIGENEITRNPRMSDAAEPTKAIPDALPRSKL